MVRYKLLYHESQHQLRVHDGKTHLQGIINCNVQSFCHWLLPVGGISLVKRFFLWRVRSLCSVFGYSDCLGHTTSCAKYSNSYISFSIALRNFLKYYAIDRKKNSDWISHQLFTPSNILERFSVERFDSRALNILTLYTQNSNRFLRPPLLYQNSVPGQGYAKNSKWEISFLEANSGSRLWVGKTWRLRR